MISREEALEYHRRPRTGKLEVVPTKPCLTQRDLALAYSPGVAEPCREIHRAPEEAYLYTGKGNLVAVVTNGSAVLGLGPLGPLASKPVMEGKAILFKRFADIDVFDIELNAPTPEAVIQACRLLEPTFGGINLEDIAAPDCFYIEEQLKATLSIPVFHDDQHGTAIISGAALLNACELVGKRLEDIKLVINGAGAAGIACAKFYLTLGARPENLCLCDRKGVLYEGRPDLHPDHRDYNPYKAQLARTTSARTLEEALIGADAFCGLSIANLLTPKMIASMAANPIIFALANPDPEIAYPEALAARPDVVMATGRSDYPNQVNNVLGFPFIFRGALDVRAYTINEAMKTAAAHALASLAKEGVPESVCRAYGMEKLEFGRDYLIPKPFDSRVLLRVTSAVAKAAGESGVARRPIDDFDRYQEQLERRLGRSKEIMRQVINKAKRRSQRVIQARVPTPGGSPASPSTPLHPIRIAFPEGEDERILRAAARIVEEEIGKPFLFGNPDEITAIAKQLAVSLQGIEVLDPHTHSCREVLAHRFFAMRARKGVTLAEAHRHILRRHYYAPLLLLEGEVDAVVCGETYHYPDSIRPALQILPLAEGIRHASGLYVLLFKNQLIFCADTTVNITPDAETLVEIALCAADTARRFDIEPKIALLSFSNFGSVNHELVKRVQEAVELVQRRRPDLVIDGEMQADTAVNEDILLSTYPFSRLKEAANVLIFPDLTSGNIAYKLLVELGGAEAIGPILMGLSKPYHVLQRGASVDAIVNIAAIAAVQAQETELALDPPPRS